MKTRAEEIESKIKAWLFPSLVTVLAALIWKDVTELKDDVKALLAQSNIDKTRIDNIERQLYSKKTVYTIVIGSPYNKEKDKETFVYNKEIALVENRIKRKPSIFLKKSKNVV